jgi:REP element-mobilizing transposase RayT
MPWIKVWIHFVWSTKDHEPYLIDSIRPQVFKHIRENAKLKGIYIDYINGYIDHVHCLISLGADQTIDAASVSPSGISGVRRYIANQEEHHRKIGFKEKFDGFMVRAGFEKFKDSVN